MVFSRFVSTDDVSELEVLERPASKPNPLAFQPVKPAKLYHPERDPSHLKLDSVDGIRVRVGYFETSKGHLLRDAVFEPRNANGITAVDVFGKGETLRGHVRLGTALAKRGYLVRMFEPLSQGHSTRLLANAQKIHDIDNFQSHRDNLAEYVEAGNRHAQRSILIAHSFGGGYAIPGLDRLGVGAFLALAPMIEAFEAPLKGPGSQKCRAYTRLMMKLGRHEEYVRGGRDYVHEEPTSNNKWTDYLPALEDAQKDYYPGSPLITSSVTVGWLNSYYVNGDGIMALPPGSISTPTHIIVALRDKILNNSRTYEATRAFADCRITQADAEHALPLGGPQIIHTIVKSADRLCEDIPLHPKAAVVKLAVN